MKKVYLIRSNNGQYKIGVSKNPKKRINQLQTGNSNELLLINTYETENATKIESALHQKFSHNRKKGEWFDLSILEEQNFTETCERIDNSLKMLKKMDNFYV